MPPKPSLTPAGKAEAKRLSREGLKQKQIAERLGVKQWTISRAINDDDTLVNDGTNVCEESDDDEDDE